MSQNTQKQPNPSPQQPATNSKANEQGKFEVMDYIKIYDPNTKEVIVEKRS